MQLSYVEHEASQSQNRGTRRTRSRMTFILNPHKTPNSFYSPSPPRSTIGRIIENLGERGTSIENCTFLHFVVELLVAPDTQFTVLLLLSSLAQTLEETCPRGLRGCVSHRSRRRRTRCKHVLNWREIHCNYLDYSAKVTPEEEQNRRKSTLSNTISRSQPTDEEVAYNKTAE